MATERFRRLLRGAELGILSLLLVAGTDSAIAQRIDHPLPASSFESAGDTSRVHDAGNSDDARFFVLGGGIGSPSGMTFIGGVYYAPIAIRFSGGYWSRSWNGAQVDLSILFNHTSQFAHGLSVVGGMFRVNPILPTSAGDMQRADRMVHYVGGTYDMYLAGFFFQIGLAHGTGDYPNPQLIANMGYLFSF